MSDSPSTPPPPTSFDLTDDADNLVFFGLVGSAERRLKRKAMDAVPDFHRQYKRTFRAELTPSTDSFDRKTTEKSPSRTPIRITTLHSGLSTLAFQPRPAHTTTDHTLYQHLHRSALIIQRCYLTHATRARFLLFRRSAVIIQRWWRAAWDRRLQNAQQQQQRQHHAATRIQAVWRGYIAQSNFTLARAAARIVQGWWRERRERERQKKEEIFAALAPALQSAARSWLVKRKYRMQRTEVLNAVTRLQRVWRRYSQKTRSASPMEDVRTNEIPNLLIEATPRKSSIPLRFTTGSHPRAAMTPERAALSTRTPQVQRAIRAPRVITPRARARAAKAAGAETETGASAHIGITMTTDGVETPRQLRNREKAPRSTTGVLEEALVDDSLVRTGTTDAYGGVVGVEPDRIPKREAPGNRRIAIEEGDRAGASERGKGQRRDGEDGGGCAKEGNGERRPLIIHSHAHTAITTAVHLVTPSSFSTPSRTFRSTTTVAGVTPMARPLRVIGKTKPSTSLPIGAPTVSTHPLRSLNPADLTHLTQRNTERNKVYRVDLEVVEVHCDKERPPSPSSRVRRRMEPGQSWKEEKEVRGEKGEGGEEEGRTERAVKWGRVLASEASNVSTPKRARKKGRSRSCLAREVG
ncbi:hypothetical protein BC937DRAFT_94129 [Endogone sp. FLAS-F59071]|nr:hypothetical protein BC937DRAFT_94129 [Endogone sp. FLAS-F59071]|eukprot:RUS14245.1 hypothetical protein BC937DRAFT_94129 [Endogone sp. FLAS-F59071]